MIVDENLWFLPAGKNQRQGEQLNKSMKKLNIVLLAIIGLFVLVFAIQFINAAKYKMTVNVVEGENIMGINPLTDELDFGDLARNNGMTRYVNIKNNGKMSVYFWVMKFGNVADLVQVEDNKFILDSGEEKKLGFSLNVLPSAEIKRYSGRVIIFRFPKLF